MTDVTVEMLSTLYYEVRIFYKELASDLSHLSLPRLQSRSQPVFGYRPRFDQWELAPGAIRDPPAPALPPMEVSA